MSDKNISRRGALRSMVALGASSLAVPVIAATKVSTSKITDQQQTPKWGMLVDLRKCVGCQACTVSCKFENNAPIGQFRTWVSDVEIKSYPHTKRQFTPRLCNHCSNPSCISVCPTGATFKREDGVVLIDSEHCWGCGSCVTACPYGARFINSETKIADKCTFCAHRLEEGLLPACAETCVGGARIFGDLNDPESQINQLMNQFDVSVLKPQTGNQPNVFYIGLAHSDLKSSEVSPNTWLVDLDNNLKPEGE